MAIKGRLRRIGALALTSSALAFVSGAARSQDASGAVAPLYGNIAPFYGKIAPFYGNISPFYGKIAPFYGKIAPFWGNIAPFWGNISPFSQPIDPSTGLPTTAKFDPFWGAGPSNPYTSPNPYGIQYSQIAGFWNTESTNWTTVQNAWSSAQTASDYAGVANLLQTAILNPANSFWGAAINKAAGPGPKQPGGGPGPAGGPGASGSSAALNAYAAAQFAQAGITFNSDGSINAASLQGVSETHQALLFLNVYDKLMSLSGTGHIDWWMGATGWSPALAAIEGTTPKGGTPPTVGMIDFAISSGAHVSKQVTQYGSGITNGHGAAVASLIMGTSDGSGVMGVVPQGSVNVVVYDPYDSTGTTNWTDVGTGIAALTNAIFKGKTVPVGVLNASLGVPGWTLNPGWNDALANANAYGHNLVIAAGNDGSTQAQNVPWNFSANPNLIIVGSVGADGTISNFSNRPGEACLLDTSSTTAGCSEANKLKYRFIVAPGEMILVSDGQGGYTRQSGTSLAAPLVSGAIALLQNRWPWLSNHPNETAQIILQSATPLGNQPGADPTYGVGELNIAASQSPLNWSNLQYYTAVNGKISPTPTPISQALAQVSTGSQTMFDATGLSFTVIEPIGTTFRDFEIPLSSKLVGQTVATGAGGQLYQSYLTSALRAQASHFAGFAASSDGAPGEFGMATSGVPTGAIGGMGFQFNMSPKVFSEGFRSSGSPYQANGALISEGSTIEFGFGEGAAVLDGHAGFGFHSDYELGRGGANPFLGLASGGGYLNASTRIAPGLQISFGETQRRDTRDLAAFGLAPGPTSAGVRHYSAQAEQIGLTYALTDTLTLRGSVTALHEASAALGVQSLDPADFKGGSNTTGVTMGFDLNLPSGLALSASGTVGSTRLGNGQFRTTSFGLVSSAAELAISKAHIFDRSDSLRLTLAKPLHVEAGDLKYESVGVVDRQTGKLGVISQSVSATSSRTPYAGEVMYGRAFNRGRGEFSLFGRADANAEASTKPVAYTGGAQLHVGF